MTVELLTAAVALALVTVLPGPDVALVTRAAVGSGRGGAARATFGVASGLVVWGLLTVLGLATLLAASATAYAIVRYVGGAYLVWLGVRALLASRQRAHGAPVSPAAVRRPFRTGLVGNLLNPKIAVFYTSALPALAPTELGHTTGLLVLVAIHAGISVIWLLAYGLLVERAASVLRRPAVLRAMDRVTGAVLIGFGAHVALARRP